MRQYPQQFNFPFHSKRCLLSSFGGSGLKSHPKEARPISTKELMHVVLKSQQATGKYSFLRMEQKLLHLIHSIGIKFNIKILELVIMSNHIHLAIKVKSRRSFQNFLRSLSGLIARKILGSERCRPSVLKEFFKGRPFSRIVANGKRSFIALKDYFYLNRLEKKGFSKSESRRLGILRKNEQLRQARPDVLVQWASANCGNFGFRSRVKFL